MLSGSVGLSISVQEETRIFNHFDFGLVSVVSSRFTPMFILILKRKQYEQFKIHEIFYVSETTILDPVDLSLYK